MYSRNMGPKIRRLIALATCTYIRATVCRVRTSLLILPRMLTVLSICVHMLIILTVKYDAFTEVRVGMVLMESGVYGGHCWWEMAVWPVMKGQTANLHLTGC